MRFFNYVTTFFVVVIALQFLPSFLQHLKKNIHALIEPTARVGVISLNGPINSTEEIGKSLVTFFKDPSIKAILLRIDSPGGASGTAQSLYQEILTLKKEHVKPIVSLVENACTSAAYYIACATDYIIAPGTAIIGSIGCSMPYIFKLNDLLQTIKVHHTALKSGTYKDATNPFVSLSAEDKTMLQELLNDSYQQFVRDVATSRKLSLASAATWAEGKLFTGQQAAHMGLIDALGSTQKAIAILKENALIEGDIEWIHHKKSSTVAKLLGYPNNDYESMLSLVAQTTITYMAKALGWAPHFFVQ